MVGHKIGVGWLLFHSHLVIPFQTSRQLAMMMDYHATRRLWEFSYSRKVLTVSIAISEAVMSGHILYIYDYQKQI